MKWEKLFERHILERGYDYYCEGVVENLKVSGGVVRADVIGSDEYEVEISVAEGEVTDMYCSCPYAAGGANCKHMAAVLYEWTQEPDAEEGEGGGEDVLFAQAHTAAAYEKKEAAVRELVENADISAVRSYLVSVLMENEKLLLRFSGMVGAESAEEGVERYIRQVDEIADRYLGRENFISYYEARGFISELEEMLDEDVRRMMDNGQYMRAFELMNYIFKLLGDVDIDDSDGGTGGLADQIYELWMELLQEATEEEKSKMFQCFIAQLDGSVIDYLEEYIERIVMEEFDGEEYLRRKMQFAEEKLEEAEKQDGWSRKYQVGKWAGYYLNFLEVQKAGRAEIVGFCRKYWDNSEVRRYYIELCMESKEYDEALRVLDESMVLDKEYRGLVAGYAKRKKEIFLLQGNRQAYISQLWQMLLDYEAGDLELYRELKQQYESEEWLEKREEVFKKLPQYAHVERLYKEEGLYDRLLDYVLRSEGLYTLQEYTEVLKKDYPEQLLQRYREELDKLAAHVGDRSKYRQMVEILRGMKRIKGGSRVVDAIVGEWGIKYRNRPAMMDELGKL